MCMPSAPSARDITTTHWFSGANAALPWALAAPSGWSSSLVVEPGPPAARFSAESSPAVQYQMFTGAPATPMR